jgi:protein involved in polysaccharide export with SLBB domain
MGLGAMVNRCISLWAVIVIGLLLAGCYTDYGPIAVEPDPIAAPATASYFQLGDRVTVTVYGEPNLSGVYDVNPRGNLDLPLIGSVRAVGRTPTEIERTIEGRYKGGKFLEEPHVTLAVVDYRPVYVFGEVGRPGSFPYRTGLNALTIVTEAGGLTYRGSRSSVLIQHAHEPAWTEYPLLSSVTILPGDLVRVPERYY